MEPRNNFFGVNHIITDVDLNFYHCRIFEICPGSDVINIKLNKNGKIPENAKFSQFFVIAEIHKIGLEALFFKILKIPQ